MAESKEQTNDNNVAEKQVSDAIDLKELAKEYRIEEQGQRGIVPSIIITLGFITGPIFLLIDLIFPRLFKFNWIDPTFLFTTIAGSFLILAIFIAWKQSRRYK